jgi:2-oxoisovalerate dehydrogenase E2 component (dihydrolipoyl transacylase)
MSSVTYFSLPDVGEGLTEAEVVTWHVGVGDVVALNDIVVDIETAKSIVELPSPCAGTVVELCVTVGETVAVGTNLLGFVTEADSVAGSSADGGPALVPATLAEPETPVPVPAPLVPSVPDMTAVEPKPKAEAPKVLVGSGVRKAALRRIRLSPPSLEGYSRTSSQVPDRAPGAADDDSAGLPGEQRLPIRGVRKATAAAMTRSAFTAPHATEWVTVDVTATMQLVRRLRQERAWQDVRLTPLVFVAKALLLAVRSFPEVNATWDEARGEIVVKSYVNLGIAAATPRGLLVPNIKDAHTFDIRGLAHALTGVVETARAGRTQPEDMARGTITITNIGAFGVDGGTPILNPGEAAILAVGAIHPTAWVVDGAIAVRETTTLSLSFDHRLVDGALGSMVLQRVGELLSRPETAILG